MRLSGPAAARRGVSDSPCCRVCGGSACQPFMSVDGRDYWRCTTCDAVLLDRAQLPEPADELAHYRHHENDPDDAGYRRFLSKLACPLTARLRGGSHGLDYGCGPGSGLAAMLRESGHTVAAYDPFFARDRSVLAGRDYDFIVCSEAAEHFHQPALEFALFDRLLKPGGWIGLMTCFRTEPSRFANWHYRRDPTHVVFYNERSLRHVAGMLGWTCEIPRKDIALMRKPEIRQDPG